MKQALIVGLGGFIGSIARYKLGGLILQHTVEWRFPLPTFAVNVAGCFIIGALGAFAERRDFFSPDARLFFFTGILGGFTTFSAFGLESANLLRRGEWLVCLSYAVLSVICGFAAVLLGLRVPTGGHH